MSIHGDQLILPLFLREDRKLHPIIEDAELVLAFHLLTKDINESEKVLSFARLLWPILSIQGVISTHILLDGLNLFSKKGKFSNPPRTPLVGHVLRNVEENSGIEILNRIIDVLYYKDSEAEEIGEGEESEYKNLHINGLINPEFLKAIMKLIPHLKIQPITDYVPLYSEISTDIALTIADQFRNTIDTMNGNGLRWQTVSELVADEVNKWITNLNVKIKDLDSRFASQISKTSSTIDNEQIREKLTRERDKIENWKVDEKKKVIENITLLFKSVERQIEDIMKRNLLFSRGDDLKSRILETIFPSFELHIVDLRDNAKRLSDLIESINQSYVELKASSTHIDIKAEERLEKLQVDLNIKLQDRDKQLSEVMEERKKTLKELNDLNEDLGSFYREIHDIIQTKKKQCIEEADDLTKWALKDTNAELFSKPIQWFYMPIYAMFIEDEDMMDERMNIVLPCYVSKNELCKEPTGAMIDLKNILIEKVEDDMKLRSNFEFSCDNKNLLKDENLKKRIQKGISILRNQELLDGETEGKIRENLKNLP